MSALMILSLAVFCPVWLGSSKLMLVAIDRRRAKGSPKPIDLRGMIKVLIPLVTIEAIVLLILSVVGGLTHCSSIFDCFLPEVFLSLVVLIVLPMTIMGLFAYGHGKEGTRKLNMSVRAAVLGLLVLLIGSLGAYGFCYPPLAWAIYHGHVRPAVILVELGADLNAKDRYLRAPLHHATRSDSTELMILLLEKGADVNVTDGYGWTPLFWVAGCYVFNPERARLLVRHGADVNAKDLWGRTLLQLVSDANQSAIVELLKEHGAQERPGPQQ
ncbi:MAG: ankyrin repeat domain-containing protein [Pseudomonadota bacterium]